MALVTADEVKEIISGCTLTTDQIDPFLLTAHVYLNKVYSGNSSLGIFLRKEIERWFTAHMIVSVGFNTGGTQQQTVKREKVGDAEIEYGSPYVKAAADLSSSAYGRMAMQLDTTGLLAAAGKQKASIYAIPSFDEDV